MLSCSKTTSLGWGGGRLIFVLSSYPLQGKMYLPKCKSFSTKSVTCNDLKEMASFGICSTKCLPAFFLHDPEKLFSGFSLDITAISLWASVKPPSPPHPQETDILLCSLYGKSHFSIWKQFEKQIPLLWKHSCQDASCVSVKLFLSVGRLRYYPSTGRLTICWREDVQAGEILTADKDLSFV